MTGRHAIDTKALKNLTASPAGRGALAALAFGAIAGTIAPNAQADTAQAGEKPSASPSASQAPASAAAPAKDTAAVKAQTQSFKLAAVEIKAQKAPEPAAQAAAQPAAEAAHAQAAAQVPVTRAHAAAAQAAANPAPAAAQAAAAAPAAQAPAAAAPASAAPAPVAATGSRAAVVNIARSLSGSPYVFGGASPAGFDCSGFVQYVFARIGIALPHSSAGQAARGVEVSAAQARPGDLVYWPGHIGIYTGNGQHMAARNPATGTFEGPVSAHGGNPTYIRILN